MTHHGTRLARGHRPKATRENPSGCTRALTPEVVRGNHTVMTRAEQQFLAVHPNPTSNEAYVVWHLPVGASEALLQVVDATGRTVFNKALIGDSGIADLPKAALPPGLYHLVLKADGLRIASTKLVAVR